MRVVCVYKSGGDFTGEYVKRMYDALEETMFMCNLDFICLTDCDDVPDYIPTKPLLYNWPKWWSKIELFREDICGESILYFDLDTVFKLDNDGLLLMILSCCFTKKMVMLSDFYQPERPAAGVLFIPKNTYGVLFDEFSKNPELHMKNNFGDQTFMLNCMRDKKLKYTTWDKVVPKGYIASYKAHVIKDYPKKFIHNIEDIDLAETRVICYHGKPRPHETDWHVGI